MREGDGKDIQNFGSKTFRFFSYDDTLPKFVFDRSDIIQLWVC
jgi:hypothetical protein